MKEKLIKELIICLQNVGIIEDGKYAIYPELGAIEINDSTIDKIITVGDDNVLLYYNMNTGDCDSIRAFDEWAIIKLMTQIENITPYDRDKNVIHKGDNVWWYDPETGKRTKYEVFENPTVDMVKLHNKYGECEALPSECLVVGKSR